ncbi:hypothetical protein LINGRAHAP2_LOCUS36762, partial [Linum grandiflorum]
VIFPYHSKCCPLKPSHILNGVSKLGRFLAKKDRHYLQAVKSSPLEQIQAHHPWSHLEHPSTNDRRYLAKRRSNHKLSQP